MDTEYKETSAALGLDGSAPETATDAGAAEAAPEVSKKTPPVWKWLAPVLLVLAAAAVIFLLIGRKSADETLFCSSMGLGALDIMIGYSMYLNAKKMGLGVTLHQWDNPLWE